MASANPMMRRFGMLRNGGLRVSSRCAPNSPTIPLITAMIKKEPSHVLDPDKSNGRLHFATSNPRSATSSTNCTFPSRTGLRNDEGSSLMADAISPTSVITAIATAVTAGVLVYNAWRKYYDERPNVQIKLSVETVNDDEDSHRVCVRIANGGKNGVFVDGYKVVANRTRELYSSDDGDVTGMLAPGSIVKHRVDYDWLASELGNKDIRIRRTW